MHNPIIVALDVESAADARAMVDADRAAGQLLQGRPGTVCRRGHGDGARNCSGEGKQVFLDLKLYDIPETVTRAVAQVARTGVRFLTVHAVSSVMRAAVAARAGSGLQILGVTVLTSFGPEDMDDLGYEGTVGELVERRARKAVEVGVDGIVASPLEAAAVRRIAGPGHHHRDARSAFGGRGCGRSEARGHARRRRFCDGADYLVIGRQITRAADPAAEVDRVLMELAQR